MKLRRIISVLMSLCLLLACVPVGAAPFTDMPEDAYYAYEAQILKSLGVVSGDPDGSLRPDDYLTRAEFAKLSVYLLDKQEEAVSNSGASAFSDLSGTHWALKYINYVVSNKLILGYPDGTFHPDENISYAQALTVCLRILGYQTSDVGSFWPDNYIQKAASLGLCDGMSYGANDPIRRSDAVLLLGRLLETDLNPATSGANQQLLDIFGYTVVDETMIISTQENDKSLTAEQVKTADGTYKTLTDDVKAMVGGLAKLYLDDEKRIVMAFPIDQYEYSFVIQEHLQDEDYICISGDTSFSYTFDENMPIYYEGTKGTYTTLIDYIEPGASLTFKGKYDGVYDYALLTKAPKITPFVVKRDVMEGDTSINGIELTDIDKLKIYRDGYAASLTDIKRNDVVYYNPAIHTMDVYIDKVTRN